MLRWMRICVACGDADLRLPYAARFLSKRISGQRIGSGPGSSTNFAEFANPAFALQICAVAQRDEQRRIPVKFRQRLLAHVASRNRQESAGEYFSQMRDEDEAFAVIDAAGSSTNPIRGARSG